MSQTSALPPLVRNRPRSRKVPGPSSMTHGFSFARQMIDDPLVYMQRMMDNYGDIVRLPFPLLPLYQTTNPDLIGKLLLATEKSNRKSLGYRRIKPLLGEGLLTSGGDVWKRQRRLSNPAFHTRVIHGFGESILQETLALADEWDRRLKTEDTIEISADLSRLTFTIIVKALFSMDLSARAADVRESMRVLQDHANYLFYTAFPLPTWVPTAYNKRVNDSLKTLNDIVFAIISEHKKRPYEDLLAVYMDSRDEETGEGMSDQHLRDEVLTLMLAGHDTTAFTLSMIFDLLAKNPEKKDKLVKELDALPESLPRIEDLPKLAYSGLVFSEAMRLYPAAWAVGRELTEELRYENYRFPKGSTFLLPQYFMHRHPRYWDRPDEFIPERFEATPRHPFAYFPFGGGQRTCIGSNLAKFEVQMILTTLLKRFDVLPVPDHRFKLLPRISLLIDNGIRVHLRKRS